jgi:alkyldihydroxyacetonephosphate synthase
MTRQQNHSPTPPIPISDASGAPRSRFRSESSSLTAAQIDLISSICSIDTDVAERADAGRDWWPISMHWALQGEVPAVPAVIARPRSTDDVSALLRLCNDQRIPVTPAGGRSGVCGASIPLYGGVLLDMTSMSGIEHIDTVSNIVEVLPGTFGPHLEADLAAAGLTLGHHPQSFDISTVGGWVACRGAGQMSTRYGKIEDMVCGLEVVLASGTVIRTGVAPRSASGPELEQLFIGSEGTLGVITRIWLRCHPVPTREERCAYSFADLSSGIDACRRIIQRSATPAVLRLYDSIETQRSHGGNGTSCALLVLDQGDPVSVTASMAVVHEECLATDGCRPISHELVDAWMHHRNDTSALQALTRKGFVVDTMEVAAPWANLNGIYDAVRSALLSVEHARAASCHLSHSYTDGACLYFSFAASPPPEAVEATYVALWDAGTTAALAAGANLSHHHGIGLNRARFVADALGSSLEVLSAMKASLDPNGILNPGKMGLVNKLDPSPRGAPWPM